MRIVLRGGLLCLLLLASFQAFAQSAYTGFYVGAMYVKVDGPVPIAEYAAGPVAITIDGNGTLSSSGDLSGSVDTSGTITFNPGNAAGFTTGTVANGTISATSVVASGPVTTTWRIEVKQTAPGYGESTSLAGRITQHHPTRTLSGMNGLTFTGSKFISAGHNGAIAISDDGLHWMPFGLPTTYHINDIAYKPGVMGSSDVYVAVGESGARFYSQDGLTWASSSAGTATFLSVAAGNGVIVALDIFGGVMTTTDGQVWTPGGAHNVGGYARVFFLNGKFVAAGVANLSFSTDGVNWSAPVNPGISMVNSGPQSIRVAYGNGKYVAAGRDAIAYSPDGNTWTKAANPTGSFDALAYGNGVFVAHAGDNRLWTSADGVSWTHVGETPDLAIAFGSGRFVGVGSELWTSTDGYRWRNPETAANIEGYAGRSLRPQDGPYGLAPVLGFADGGNVGRWWYGRDGYMYYHLNTLFGLYGETNVVSSTLHAFVGYSGNWGVFAGADGALIHIAPVAGKPPALTVLPRVTSETLLTGTRGDNVTVIFVGTGGVIVRNTDNTMKKYSVVAGGGATLRNVAFFSTAYGHQTPINLFIALGDDGTLLTSSTGHVWTKQQIDTTETLVSTSALNIDGAPHLRVVTVSGETFTSTDGIVWTQAAPLLAAPQQPNTVGVNSLAFGNGRWVGLGQNAAIASSDSFTWQARPTMGGLSAVAAGKGMFVAVSAAGTSATSHDGLRWELRTNVIAGLRAIAHGAGKFVAVGGPGRITVSDDGISWTDKSLTGSQGYDSVIYANGRFVATGSGGAIALSEDAGATWATANTRVGDTYALAGGGGLYVAGGADGWTSYSNDGRNWTSKRMPYRGPIDSYPDFVGAAFANGTFHLFANQGELYTTTNGIDFTQSHTGLRISHVAGIAVGNGRIMIAGEVIHSLTIETAGLPIITAQPQPITRSGGESATFSVAATGPDLVFQWFKNGDPVANGGDISGATSSTLEIANLESLGAGAYHVVVRNSSGSISSSVATLMVQAAPAIVLQPEPVNILQGLSTTLRVRVVGQGPFNYQWRRDGSPLTGSVNLVNVDGPTLALASPGSEHSGEYDVVITNPYGSITSEKVLVTVNEPPTAPVILTQPVNVNVQEGGTMVLTVIAKGGQPMTYTWKRTDGRPLTDARVTGQGTATLTISNAQPEDAGTYYVNISNSLGQRDSSFAIVTVLGELGFRADFTISTDGTIKDIVQVGSEQFVIAGSLRMSDGEYSTEGLAKINGTGKLIAGFPAVNPGPGTYIQSIAKTSDGKLIVGGQFNSWGGNSDYKNIARLNADGTLDTSFNIPEVNANIGPWIAKIIILSDGKILVGRYGTSTTPSSVTRYNADGAIDSSFTQHTIGGFLTLMDVQADGTIYYAGNIGLKKLPATGGSSTTPIANGVPRGLRIAPSGEIYYGLSGKLYRHRADGGRDFGFFLSMDQHSFIGPAFAFLDDGQVLVGGDFRGLNGVVNPKLGILNAAGQVNAEFKSPFALNSSGGLEVILPLEDGSILVGGNVRNFSQQQNLQRIQITKRQSNSAAQTFAQWLDEKGFTPGVNDGLQQDADADGLSNLAEFALGTNPLAAGADQKPRATTFQGNDQTHAAIQFTRNKNASGATILISASTSLTVHSNETVVETVEDLGNGLERVTVRSTQPLSLISTLFFHVKVSEN